MEKLKHIKRTVCKHGWTQWSAPELRNARVWKRDGVSWELTIRGINVMGSFLYQPSVSTLKDVDARIGKIIRMSNHELVETAYRAKAKALDMMASDKYGYNRRTAKLWSDRADLVMLLYRDRINQHVDGQVVLAAE